MTKSVIPKEKNTSEIIRANLLKHKFIVKRQAIHGNAIPLKYRNNLKLAIKHFDKERTNVVNALNVALYNTKIKQDNQNKNEIFELYYQRIQANSKLKELKKYLTDLNKEIGLWQKREYQKQIELNVTKEKQKTFGNVENVLFTKAKWYNNGLKKQKELRHKLDCMLKEMTLKNKLYDSIMCQLNKEAIILVDIGEGALKSSQERKKALNDLLTFRETKDIEKKRREEKMYMTKYKLKMDLELNKFIKQKHTIRRNEFNVSSSTNDKQDNIKKKINFEEIIAFIKYLIHIGGDTDLRTIMDNIEKMDYDKESLFRLLVFFEQRFTGLENSINNAQNIAINKKTSIGNKNEINNCGIQSYLKNIQTNDEIIKTTRKFTNNLMNMYNELNDKIYSIVQALEIKQSSMKKFGIIDPPNEKNILNYIKEIENKSVELLFKVNCVENSCIIGQTEDPLTSDAESTENLIIKDYDGIQIKMHRYVHIQDESTLPVPTQNLDIGETSSLCPNCTETRFRDDGQCSLISTREMKALKENLSLKTLEMCCTNIIKQINLKNVNSTLATLLHDKDNCKNTPKI